MEGIQKKKKLEKGMIDQSRELWSDGTFRITEKTQEVTVSYGLETRFN